MYSTHITSVKCLQVEANTCGASVSRLWAPAAEVDSIRDDAFGPEGGFDVVVSCLASRTARHTWSIHPRPRGYINRLNSPVYSSLAPPTADRVRREPSNDARAYICLSAARVYLV